MIRRGRYPDLKDKPTFTLGYDFVGIVEALGEGVSELRVGDRVADLTMVGSNARFVIRRADSVVRIPDHLDPAEQVALVLSWMTAYQMLHRTVQLEPGQTILVQGGMGAVGSAAARLASLVGARVLTTASAKDHDVLRQLGYTVIDRHADLCAEVMRHTEGRGVDVVLGFSGGADMGAHLKALTTRGVLVQYGFHNAAQGRRGWHRVAGDMLRMVSFSVWPNGKKATFYSITSYRKKHPQHFVEDLRALNELLARQDIQPAIAERMPLENAREAHERMEVGGLEGKLVLVP